METLINVGGHYGVIKRVRGRYLANVCGERKQFRTLTHSGAVRRIKRGVRKFEAELARLERAVSHA